MIEAGGGRRTVEAGGGKRLIEAGRSPDPAQITDPATDMKALLKP